MNLVIVKSLKVIFKDLLKNNKPFSSPCLNENVV